MSDNGMGSNLRLDDLPHDVVVAIAATRYDRVLEKHEGPWDWRGLLRDDGSPGRADFLDVEGRAVLLPVGREDHSHLTVLRAVVSTDGETLVLFLRDGRAVEW